MKPKRRRCPFCGRFFQPDSRARVQACCGRPVCQRARKRRNLRRWRSLHPDHKERYAAVERAWAKAYPDYWQARRGNDPDYAARDDQRRSESRRRAKVSANETVMRRILVDKVRALDRMEVSANETGILRRVGAIEDCLRSTVAVALSANETGIEGPGPPWR